MYGSNYLTGDPLFVSPGTGNFHLQADSPARDRGIALGAPVIDFDGIKRPQGTGYDLGAFEFSTHSDPDSPTGARALSGIHLPLLLNK
jgi:hypothetical protein